MQKNIAGKYGRELVEALSDEEGNIDYNCMFELIMGFSIGREQLETSPFEPHVSTGFIGNKRVHI